MSSDLDRPIIIVGAARSGTNLLGSIINLHPEIAYAGEANYIWKYSHAWLGHDMIPAWRATPRIRAYIRRRFVRFCRDLGKDRLCEKTPANSMRLAFIMQVLPDAKVIHIVRDGRDVVASARRKMHGDTAKISRTVSGSGVTTRQSLDYATFKRIWKLARHRFDIGVPARDFIFYVVLNYLASHPETNCLQLRYEDLCDDPLNTARQIYAFCELEISPEIEKGIRAIFADFTRIRSLKLPMTQEEEQTVNDYIAYTRSVLRYTGAQAGTANAHGVPHADGRTVSV